MFAVTCFALLVAASAAPAPATQQSQEVEPQARSTQAFLLGGNQGAQQIPAGAQIVYLQGYGGQYASAAPAQGAQIAYILAAPQGQQQYQVSSVQPSTQVSTIQYTQPQQVQVKFQPQQQQVHLQEVHQQVQYKAPEVVHQHVQYKAPEVVHQHVQYKAPEVVHQHVQYKAPEIKTKVYTQPAPAPAPAPVVKQYQVHENQVPTWAIIRQNLDDNFDGNFQYDFETENGIALSASGAVRQLSPKEQGQGIQGQYSYTAPDGQVITTYYTADENGFVAHGDHLPQAPLEPELPPLIAKSLAYIRSLPPQPEYQQ